MPMPTPAASVVSSRPEARPYPPRRVYSVVGVPPEIQAYALAKYSRSSQGMLESIQELSAQKAEQFLDTFYFQYGHRSIADLAHLVFGLEQISILAAIAGVDEPVGDGDRRQNRDLLEPEHQVRQIGDRAVPILKVEGVEELLGLLGAQFLNALEHALARARVLGERVGLHLGRDPDDRIHPPGRVGRSFRSRADR